MVRRRCGGESLIPGMRLPPPLPLPVPLPPNEETFLVCLFAKAARADIIAFWFGCTGVRGVGVEGPCRPAKEDAEGERDGLAAVAAAVVTPVPALADEGEGQGDG